MKKLLIIAGLFFTKAVFSQSVYVVDRYDLSPFTRVMYHTPSYTLDTRIQPFNNVMPTMPMSYSMTRLTSPLLMPSPFGMAPMGGINITNSNVIINQPLPTLPGISALSGGSNIRVLYGF